MTEKISEESRALEYRKEFPCLAQEVYNNTPLVYLDNAATNQVSSHVIEAITRHLQSENANTHRGIHRLSELATQHFEETRASVAGFINAEAPENIIFTAGATAALNTVALGLEPIINDEDSILVTQMEHHSNFLPWQQICKRTGTGFRIAPLTNTGEIDLTTYYDLLSNGRVKIAAFTYVSNVTGVRNPVKEMIAAAKSAGALTILDAAQAARACPLDMQQLGCDYCCFSAHKMIGPTGVGILYGNHDALQLLALRSFGGGMVDQVNLRDSDFSEFPYRMEAGTPNIIGVAGLHAAIEDLARYDKSWIYSYECRLLAHAQRLLQDIPGVRILGNFDERVGALSFTVQDCHPYDLASIMDKKGIAVRVGHHCAIPHLQHYGHTAVMRLSPAFYNTFNDLDRFADALDRAITFLQRWNRK